MAPRYRTVEPDQMMLLPHDLREWIPVGDIVHFIIEAATLVPVGKFEVNERGTGEEQYHGATGGSPLRTSAPVPRNWVL